MVFGDEGGDSPLHLAVQYKSVEIIKILIRDDNISIDILNSEGKSPLDVANFSNKTEIVELLKQEEWKRRYNTASRKYEHMVELLKTAQIIYLLQVFPEIPKLRGGEYDSLLLYVAAQRNNTSIIHELINKKNDVLINMAALFFIM